MSRKRNLEVKTPGQWLVAIVVGFLALGLLWTLAKAIFPLAVLAVLVWAGYSYFCKLHQR